MHSLETSNKASEVSTYETKAIIGTIKGVIRFSFIRTIKGDKFGIPQTSSTPIWTCNKVWLLDPGTLSWVKGIQRFETAEDCVKPNSAPYFFACTEKCNFIGTHYKGAGFQLASHNAFKYDDMNRENYGNTSLVKYYPEICSKRRQICALEEYNNYCTYGNFYFSVLDSLRITNEIEWLCLKNFY